MVHEIWKIQYQLADAKIDWLTWWCSSRFTRYCTLNSSYCKKRHIFCLVVLQTLISAVKSTWLAFKICLKRFTLNFFMDNFDLVLLSKLSYSLCSGLLWTLMCSNFHDVNILKNNLSPKKLLLILLLVVRCFTEATTGGVL